MGWWAEQVERESLKARIRALEEENALYVRMLNGVVWPDPTECADCGRPVTRALGSPVVICADCAGPHVPISARPLMTPNGQSYHP